MFPNNALHVTKPTKSPSRSATTSRQEPTSPSATVAAMAPESAHPIPPAASAASNPTATSSSSSTTPLSNAQIAQDSTTSSSTTTAEGELRQLLKEANSMLKEMRQLNMLTVRDVDVKAKSLGMEPSTGRSGLLDSGASHAFRLGTHEELQAADKVRVQLATGDSVTLAQNRAGTLLATKSTEQDMASPIVPLGSLVQDLNCKLTWSRKRGLEIKHPIHGLIKPRVVGQCPLVGEAQALQLIKELEDKRVERPATGEHGDAKNLVGMGQGGEMVFVPGEFSYGWKEGAATAGDGGRGISVSVVDCRR